MEFLKNFFGNLLRRMFRVTVLLFLMALMFSASVLLTGVALKLFSGNGYYRKAGDLPAYSKTSALRTTGKEKYHPMIRLHSTEDKAFFCSAFVISDDYAITADHCFRMTGQDTARIFNNEAADTGVDVELVGAIEATDLAIVQGNFKEFRKLMVDTSSYGIINKSGPFLACGFPYGENPICTPFRPMSNQLQFIIGAGFMYQGMSGGPVIDAPSGIVFAVNRAIEHSGIIVAPIIGLFNRLEIKVVP